MILLEGCCLHDAVLFCYTVTEREKKRQRATHNVCVFFDVCFCVRNIEKARSKVEARARFRVRIEKGRDSK